MRIMSLCRLAAVVLLAAPGCKAWIAPTASYHCRDCNVVLISVDTLRADHVGTYGYSRPTTPNIDALAARAVVFDDAIAQSSWTRAAHMSIFTGLHPREHGYVALADRERLPEGVPTLASVLRHHGYATVGFVGGVNVAAAYGFDQGFDSYRSSGRMFRDNFEEARYWLGENSSKRFFLFLHGYEAHTPYSSDPSDRIALGLPRDSRTKGLRAVCKKGEDPAAILPFIDAYDSAIHRADRYVGKLLAELDRLGLRERTVVVLLSDHGEEFLEHGGCFHISTLYHEVLQVPLMIAAPGLGVRRVAETVSASVTIAPTIMELLGITGHPFGGPSLAAAALGGAVPEQQIVSETERSEKAEGFGHLRALTTGGEKLVDWITGDRREYFDLRADPAERRTVENPARVETLRTELARWTQSHPPKITPRRSASEEDPGSAETKKLEEELRSLGYLQ